MKPFTELRKKNRSIPLVEAQARYHARKSEESFSPTPAGVYDRGELSAIAYADVILRHHRRLDSHGYLDGKRATFHQRIVAANQILKARGLAQINGSHEWPV